MSIKYFKFQVNGAVQGVNFRQWTKKSAQSLTVTGWIRNADEGHVEGEALGLTKNMEDFKNLLSRGPRHAEVSDVIINDEQEVDDAASIGWKLRDFEVRR